MIKPINGIALALLILTAATTQAVAKDYQVELLIFSNETSDTLDDEIWPEISSVPARNARNLGYKESSPAGSYYTRLPKSAMQLSGKQASLRRSPEYRVLFHETWVQPVGTSKQGTPIRVRGGEILDNGLYELDGFISVDRGRYLHFRSDLFHSRQLTPSEYQMLIKATPAISPENTETDPAGESAPALPVTSTEESSINGNRYLTQTTVPDFLTVEMKSARRMRSKELHYLDHPLFGALVIISPVE
ncbi:MAG: peptidoglycan binding protein CsiV [Amphritea sp.]|nr:peptidoglycan binding protein CsiV [Amphritea sp.]